MIDGENETKNSNDEILINQKSQIMKNIIFVLNGFENRLHTELKTKATSMGAIYNEDWNKKCTHLICAFANTPIFAQVEQSRQGYIVNKQWILDCYKFNKLLSEKSYILKLPKEKKLDKIDTKKKSSNKRKSLNDSEDKSKKIQVNELPDFFHGIHFYVSYGDYDDFTLLDIVRVIFAYDGILERQINSDVKYVITNRMWNQDFEKISKSNPDIKFINLDWLQDCHDANQFVDVESYITVR